MSEELDFNKLDFTNIEATEGQGLPALLGDKLITLADKADKLIAAWHKIRNAALRITNTNDWVDESGKPYLQASGAVKIGRVFGIGWGKPLMVITNLDEGHYLVTFSGEFRWQDITIETIGSRSSNEKFFTTKAGGVTVPASEVDRGDVVKAAYTNWLARGITTMIGLQNLRWEELAVVGIIKDEAAKVAYKKKESEQARDAVTKLPNCPKCGKDALGTNKAEWGGGYACYKIKNGCGAKFKTLDEIATSMIKEADKGEKEKSNGQLPGVGSPEKTCPDDGQKHTEQWCERLCPAYKNCIAWAK